MHNPNSSTTSILLRHGPECTRKPHPASCCLSELGSHPTSQFLRVRQRTYCNARVRVVGLFFCHSRRVWRSANWKVRACYLRFCCQCFSRPFVSSNRSVRNSEVAETQGSYL